MRQEPEIGKVNEKGKAASDLLHFWDSYPFGHRFTEQRIRKLNERFRQFFEQLSNLPAAQQGEALGRLLDRAGQSDAAYGQLARWADRYLGNPESAQRDESFYIRCLEHQLASPVLSEAEKERARFQLGLARKNRVGQCAADFSCVTNRGDTLRLSTFRPGKRMVLILFNPTCRECQRYMAQLSAHSEINRLIRQDSLSVLAVNVNGDRPLWDRMKDDLPPNWTVAIDQSNLADKDDYDFRKMPAVFLLSGDRRIELKYPDCPTLVRYVQQVRTGASYVVEIR